MFSLEYGRKRKHFRFGIGIAILFCIAAASWKWGRTVAHATAFQYYQWQCMRFAMPQDSVAYDSDPHRAAIIAATSPEYYVSPLGLAYYPAPLRSITSSMNGRIIQGVLFMHERISPAGHRRLVLVQVPSDKSLLLRRQAVIPGSWFGSLSLPQPSPLGDFINLGMYPGPLQDDASNAHFAVNRTNLKRDKNGLLKLPLRIFFGQADPNDGSHFTIRYEVGTEQGTIDGWLGDDDAIRMQAHGPWATPPGTFQKAGKDIMVP